MPSSFTNLDTHIIFSTKDRESWLCDGLLARACDYIGGICRKRECVLTAAGGTPDHVHLLVSLHPTVCVADLVRDIKSNSSGWIHDTFPDHGTFAWQRCYGAFAVSESNVAAVKQYIATQEEHHRWMSYKEEFIALLERHRIPHDPKWAFE
jgi:REP element-mobilizing transposase RayT